MLTLLADAKGAVISNAKHAQQLQTSVRAVQIIMVFYQMLVFLAMIFIANNAAIIIWYALTAQVAMAFLELFVCHAMTRTVKTVAMIIITVLVANLDMVLQVDYALIV